MAEFLYDDFLGSLQFDPIKSNTAANFSMENNYVTEEGVYTGGMSVNPMFNNFSSAPTNSVLDLQTPSTQLPQDLANMVNSLLLDSDGFPLTDNLQFENSQLDIDVAAIDLDDDGSPFGDDIFGTSADSLLATTYETLTPVPEQSTLSLASNSTGSARPQRKSKRRVKTLQPSSHLLLDDASTSSANSLGYEPQYPSLSELRVPSPALSTSSGYSDSCGEETQKKIRQRRPRVSYNTLTEEEKYKRIRDLNNEASKHYRERQKTMLTTWEQQLPGLLEKNEKLQKKAEGLEVYRDNLEQFTHQVLRQYMQNSVSQDFKQ